MNNQILNVNFMYYNNIGMGSMSQVFGNSYGFANMQMQQMQYMQMQMMQMMMQMQTMIMVQKMGGQAWMMNGVGSMQQLPPFPNLQANKNQISNVQENKSKSENANQVKARIHHRPAQHNAEGKIGCIIFIFAAAPRQIQRKRRTAGQATK